MIFLEVEIRLISINEETVSDYHTTTIHTQWKQLTEVISCTYFTNTRLILQGSIFGDSSLFK